MAEEIRVPNIGGAENVDVIEVTVSVGDTVALEDPLITLEGDKATMEVPSPSAGVVESIDVAVGDKVSEGSLILRLKTSSTASGQQESTQTIQKTETTSDESELKSAEQLVSKTSSEPVQPIKDSQTQETIKEETLKSDKSTTNLPLDELEDEGDIHAGPGVRRLAHDLALSLGNIQGSGVKGRILKKDVHQYVKKHLISVDSSSHLQLPKMPSVDFSQWGPIDKKPLAKIKKTSGAHLARCWATIPHVTQFDEADITELEAFRQVQKVIAAKQNLRLTPLVFIMKAVVAALAQFPLFNASLDGEHIIYKKYFNIGVAVDTPNGLVVPVIRDVDKKGLFVLAKELGDISTKAREKGLGITDMQGGCFTISSLGGIGGSAFTPIINAPEVAILGVSKSVKKPIVQPNNELLPRLMLPLSLSYDHRVIDGAEAARFIVFLSSRLADIRNILL